MITNHRQSYQGRIIVIALGSNLAGAWGTPEQILHRAIGELAASGIQIVKTSRIYRTRAHSDVPQPNFLNAIATVSTPIPANALLRLLKRIEAQAGRRSTAAGHHPFGRWTPRPLDLDIVSYKGVVRNWRMNKPMEGMRVVLPHPRAHERAFVLRPLCEVAPRWHHPVFGLTACELLKRPRVRETGEILSAGEFLR